MPPEVDSLVAALASAIEAAELGTVSKFEMDFQASGEIPYRVHVAEEVLPLIGLANVGDVPERTSGFGTSVAQGVGERTSNG